MNTRRAAISVTLGLLACSMFWLTQSTLGGSLARLPGTTIDASLLESIRAGEQKKYPQCRSMGTTCSYANVCALDPDDGGCVNNDGCPSCSGGTNASCTGPMETTRCIDDTLSCCYLGKSCELRSSGCTCTMQGATMVGTIQFCGG